jgi:hypothetical protein
MKKALLILLTFISANVYAQSWKEFQYQNGDLLFQDLDCGELCDAIEAVTPAIDNRHFSHVALVYKPGDSVYVIEAIGKDVHITPIDKFLMRQLDAQQQPKVVVGRLKKGYQKLNSRAVGFALKQLNKPYDDNFIYDNGKYYCSELIHDAYKEANDGISFFNLYPMTFKDPKSGNTFKAWKKYFKELDQKIPEGKQGCNPGSIAMSSSVDIVTAFYK